MPYPSPDEFLAVLRERRNALEGVVREFLFRGEPYAFEGRAHEYQQLLGLIANGLELSQRALTIVGSGRIGFSLDPYQFGRPFSTVSDLDVIVVSAELFDQAWMNLLTRWPRLRRLDPSEQEWYRKHKELVYWGKIWPDKLMGVLDIGSRWFQVFSSLSRYPPTATRRINGLLYRSWQHAEVYHRDGLYQIVRLNP